MKPRRPFSIKLLFGLVSIVTMVNLVRVVLTLQRWQFLDDLLPMSPAYLVICGLVWCLAGLPLLWGLWRGEVWAPRATLLASLAYSLYYWVDRLLTPGYTGRNFNWPFALGMNLVILLWSFWVLSRPKAGYYFGEMHERRSQNSRTA